MEWIKHLNQAINYIEANLTNEIDYDEVAKQACCSTYHFQRMFGYMADLPLSEYIRRRRMSLAAMDLQDPDQKVLDIGLKYGYASPTAFNRAFQSVHGVAPSSVKKQGVTLKIYPPISFAITVKGVEEMNYKIEKKEAFRIVGVGQPMFKDIEKNMELIPPMWPKATADGTIAKLAAMIKNQPQGILGVSACGGNADMKYYIGVASDAPIDGTLEEYNVPAFTWAIFAGEGVCPKAMQDLQRRIVTEWLPNSGYEFDNGPDIEVYYSPDPQEAKFEVWVPVIKK